MKASTQQERRRLTVTGVVQGVGFRPFVYSLATDLGLAGFVGNNSGGVFIELEGTPAQLDHFQTRLLNQAPPLAHIENVSVEPLTPTGETGFTIVHSQAQAAANTLISPDICICDDCLAELFDPADRRYRYPFINCTNCGPRFTIIKDIPYDRPQTTMAVFPMCPACQAEYDDPRDRRFHAQPNACDVCGPHVWFEWSGEQARAQETGREGEWVGDEAIACAQEAFAQGRIVAVKGLGGFHLACDAGNDQALADLRRRKGRVDKPFALMALDIADIQQYAEVSPAEAKLLTSKERPIVLLRKKEPSPLSELVAPGNPFIGFMLPYTPLHYLLLHFPPALRARLRAPVLVMTSGNYSDEPIVKDNEEARARLSALADAFLMHDRDIHVHCDDSVIRVYEGEELPVRRSRGYAPFPVKLPFDMPPLLAVGGELKSTFCLTKGHHAFMSQHIGDMENLETLQAFARAVQHFQSIFRVEPTYIVADLHPRYLSTRWAQEQARAGRLVQVQHHHAHIAAVMAEHGLDGSEPVIGFSFDGTGYGTDGAIWGGEVLLADYDGFKRIAHLRYFPLPGGDAAIKRPYRVALAQLWAAGIAWAPSLPSVQACPPTEQRILQRQLERTLNTIPTSSMGRLFDAVASLAGVRQTITYEAQAAIEFEALVAKDAAGRYSFAWPDMVDLGSTHPIDATPLLQDVVADITAGVPAPVIATRFHKAVADLILHLSQDIRRLSGCHVVALSGGVFQNVTLLTMAAQRLRQADFTVLHHRLVPPNDGGLALGQALIGARQTLGPDR